MTKTTEMTNNNELNEMELEQVNGGCDPQRVSVEMVYCKGCDQYYLKGNYHVCFVGAVVDHDHEF